MSLKPKYVHYLIKCLNDHKSSVNFPNKLIKIAAQPLSIPLKYIYNQSIETGIVPDILKVSQVSPLYKDGDATDPSNSLKIQ